MSEKKSVIGSKGFSLVEAVLAVAIFSVATIILFNCINVFFRIWNKQDVRSDININFLKAYKSINDDLSLSSTDYFDFYGEKDVNPCYPSRWFLYTSASSDKRILADSTGSPIWNKVVLYYLIRPANDPCSSADNCPHKILMRTEHRMKSLDPASVDKGINDIISSIENFIKPPGDNFYPEMEKTSFLRKNRVAENIVDLQVEYIRGSVFFEITALKEKEARKNIAVGNINLTDRTENLLPYLEILRWRTVNKNL